MPLGAEERQLHHVTKRLLAEFGSTTTPEVVKATAHSIAAQWSAAPVQEFVHRLDGCG
jgi:hypothetical protein